MWCSYLITTTSYLTCMQNIYWLTSTYFSRPQPFINILAFRLMIDLNFRGIWACGVPWELRGKVPSKRGDQQPHLLKLGLLPDLTRASCRCPAPQVTQFEDQAMNLYADSRSISTPTILSTSKSQTPFTPTWPPTLFVQNRWKNKKTKQKNTYVMVRSRRTGYCTRETHKAEDAEDGERTK